MAGRAIMPALKFFRLDCDFFTNRKIKSLRRAHGTIGLATYIYILCKVYDNGYYLEVKDLNQFSYDVAENIANKQLASVAARVRESIDYMADCANLLDRGYLNMGILTSHAIQEQYSVINAQMKRKAQIGEYDLLTPRSDVEEIANHSETMPISSEEIANHSETMRRDRDREYREYRESKERDSSLDLDSLDSVFSAEDAAGIRQAFAQSKWLRQNIRSTRWVREHLKSILTGYYQDHRQPQSAQSDVSDVRSEERKAQLQAQLESCFTQLGEIT